MTLLARIACRFARLSGAAQARQNKPKLYPDDAQFGSTRLFYRSANHSEGHCVIIVFLNPRRIRPRHLGDIAADKPHTGDFDHRLTLRGWRNSRSHSFNSQSGWLNGS